MRRSLALALAVLGGACAKTDAPSAPATGEAPVAASAGPAAASAVATVRDIHMTSIIPGSNVLFAAEGEAPDSAADWMAAVAAADQVIQGAERMRAPEFAQNRAEWVAAVDQVIVATRQTRLALEQQVADDLVFTNGDMMTGCTACHQQFRQTPASTPAP